MDLFIASYRTVFFYFFMLLVFRLMGKREIGQLSIIDLVVSILIAELVAISIENIKDPILLTIVPITIIFLLQIISAFIALKSKKFRDLMEGKPALIIDKGIINYKEMIKQRYTLDDLLLELRIKNIKNLKDIEYAILENNGKLSIFKYNFLRLDSTNPFPLILDGIIQKDTLKYINKDISWLNELLIKNDIKIDNVFYAFYKNNKAYIIKKTDLR